MNFFGKLLLLLGLLVGALVARQFAETNVDDRIRVLDDFHYHWGQLPQDKMAEWVSLPNAWHKKKPFAELSSEKNTDVLWLMLPVMEDLDLRGASLFFPGARYKLEVFVDYEKIYAFGDPSSVNERRFLGLPFHIIDLPDSVQSPFIFVRLFSPFEDIGIEPPVLLGPATSIIKRVVREALPALIIAAAPLLIGLLLVLIYVRFIMRQEILYLGLLFLLFAGFLFFRSPLRQLMLPEFPTYIFDILSLCCLYLLPACFLGFTHSLLEFGKSWIVAGAQGFFVLLALVAGMSLVFDTFYHTRLNIAFQIGVLGSVLIFFASSRRLEQTAQHRFSRDVTIGLAVVAATAIVDILIQRGVLKMPFYLSVYAFVLFLFLLLRLLFFQLKEQAEEQILLRNELETVGVLQANILKDRTANHDRYNVTVFFRPALFAAGDWYDHKLINDRWLVMHVGDVTGHGAAAALNASYAKGCIQMHTQINTEDIAKKPNLTRLHNLLNKSLIEIGRSRITMTLVSIIVDIRTGEFEYLNSGHVPPLLFSVTTKGFRPLLAVNSGILGLDADFRSELPTAGTLRPDQMLLLQTDGIGDVYSNIAAGEFRIKGSSSLSKSISFLSKIGFRDPHTLCAGIETRLKAVAEDYDQQDDATILAFKLKESA